MSRQKKKPGIFSHVEKEVLVELKDQIITKKLLENRANNSGILHEK